MDINIYVRHYPVISTPGDSGLLNSVMRQLLVLAFVLFTFSKVTFAQKAPSHQQWDKLVKKHVDKMGLVNYKGFQKDKGELDSYLKLLSDNGPKDSWSDNEQKAFWINAYNAFTVSLILKHYPVKSIKEIGGSIYKINTAWDIKFININGKKMDLNNIESGTLRKKWDDARIHFAVNCASMSCPALRNEAYTADRLEAQLDDAGKRFLADKTKNDITAAKARLSKIFSWYKGDFKKNGGVVNFINKYSSVNISSKTSVDYNDYDWALNEQ